MNVNTVTQMEDAAGRDLRRLREATGRVVGSVFFGTLLKTMRDSSLKGPYGHGGRGEAVFAEQLHRVLAERMGMSLRRGVGDALYRKLEPQQERISNQNNGVRFGT